MEKHPEVVPGGLDEKEAEYYLEFFCNGAYAVNRKWISGGFVEPIETIAGILDSTPLSVIVSKTGRRNGIPWKGMKMNSFCRSMQFPTSVLSMFVSVAVQ